ncbi:MAG: hypothetical protein HC793_00360 [Aquincola sp.]|nr:hypothetical protein [Aquincola sp.]
MKLAAKFKLPIIAMIDTPGAFPGIGAEERLAMQLERFEQVHHLQDGEALAYDFAIFRRMYSAKPWHQRPDTMEYIVMPVRRLRPEPARPSETG